MVRKIGSIPGVVKIVYLSVVREQKESSSFLFALVRTLGRDDTFIALSGQKKREQHILEGRHTLPKALRGDHTGDSGLPCQNLSKSHSLG